MRILVALLALTAFSWQALGQEIPLTDLSRLQPKDARVEIATYRGSPALKISEKAGGRGEALAVIGNLVFHSGAIELDVSGNLSKTADPTARGFIGVAFRMAPEAARFECIYIRPDNGRADDQLRRNHSTQYVSFPDWPWERLRKESPGVYESYADMALGEWIHLRIVVEGMNASLYVNGVAEPCLIVHDLKLGDSQGSVGLWIGPGTEGYFRNLTISR
jgi:hypothetical protein